MDIQTRKIEFVQEFLKLQNEDLLSRLEKILHSGSSETNKNLRPITINDLNERIDKSMEDSKNDRLISTDDLIAEAEKWD